MPESAAFISYSHKYKPWVLTLQKNLELCLAHHDATPSRVFLDQVDLLLGRSWVGRLDEGLAEAKRLILVITPEAMASPRVEAEWQAWIGQHCNWERDRLIIPIELIETANTPPTLAHIQRADFKNPDPDAYRWNLRLVLGVMLGKKDGRDLPELPDSVTVPESPPPLPPPDDALPRYLDLVRQDHESLLPLFDRDAETELLEKVFVSLALQPDQGLGKAKDERLAGAPLGPMGLRQLLELDRAEHRWITRRWVVRGDPGSGKTTLLRHLTSTLAGEKEPRWIPAFCSLPRLVREGCSVLGMLKGRLERGDIGADFLDRLDEHGKSGRLLVLLDGLDEVPGDKREDAEELLLGVMQRWPETPIVVSSRPIGYDRPHDAFREVDVQPLGRGKQIDFLARRLRDKSGEPDTARAKRELAVLDRHPNLGELASNPLYLTLMSYLIEDGVTLSGSRAQLYDDIFRFLLKGKHRKRRRLEKVHAIKRPDLVKQALRHVAYEMSQQNRDTTCQGDLVEHLESDERLCLKLGRVRSWRDDLSRFFDDVAELTSILAPHDGKDEDWRYWHRTFREALTAEKLETLWQQDEELILQHVKALSDADDEEQDKSRWAEAYAFLAGRLEEPDALIMALIEQDRDLGLRAFEGVQKLKVETLHQLFASEDWNTRCAAYRRLPDLVETAERSLELIDELRRQTRDGTNLFFLDLAAQRTGERWPEAKPDADLLRARLHDHIPEPPQELFQWIETCDGRVQLWREIPEGSFLMGKPDEDEQAADHEKPQHRVTLLEPFLMASVPVTQKQYAAFDPDHESYHQGTQSPVDRVTWYDAVSFCRWLGTFAWAKGARLPCEEEWEYACRAGTQTLFWSGDTEADLDRVGWYLNNSGHEIHAVGEKAANEWELYDVHGNVWEWTASEGSNDYAGRGDVKVDPRSDLAAPSASPSAERVVRGGSCWSTARDSRSTFRYWVEPGIEDWDRGFRVVRPVPRGDR